MREIKFRGKDEESGNWVYGYYTKLVEGIRKFDAIISEIDGELTRFYIHNNKTIGQYTGLKDKNGKEIYEGDILRVGEYDEECCLWLDADNHIVKDHSGEGYPAFDLSPGLDCDGMNSIAYIFQVGNDECEIIGNIHENPELLDA